MNIDIHYVWAGILGWSAVSLLAMAFLRGADERRNQNSRRDSGREAWE